MGKTSGEFGTVLAFQRAHELPTSGLLDTPTRDALTREHGT